MMDRTPEQQKLVDATNLLAEYAEKNLPAGYTIVLEFFDDECSLELVNPDGEDIVVHPETCAFADACEAAHQEQFTKDGGWRDGD